MGFLMGHSAWQIDQFPTCWPMNGLFVCWSRGWGVSSFSERLVLFGCQHYQWLVVENGNTYLTTKPGHKNLGNKAKSQKLLFSNKKMAHKLCHTLMPFSRLSSVSLVSIWFSSSKVIIKISDLCIFPGFCIQPWWSNMCLHFLPPELIVSLTESIAMHTCTCISLLLAQIVCICCI